MRLMLGLIMAVVVVLALPRLLVHAPPQAQVGDHLKLQVPTTVPSTHLQQRSVAKTARPVPTAEPPMVTPIAPTPQPFAPEEASPLPLVEAEGVPAIPPSQAGVPAFTEQDVRAFLATHSHPDRTPGMPLPVIEEITFLTEQALRDQLHTSTGLADETMLCLVRLRGDFQVVGPPPGPIYSATRGHLVFHGRTGNILIEGVDIQ